jgi:Ca-activated chloride channel homolog
MSFTWPFALLGLVLVPILVGLYVLQLRRRRKNAVRFSSVSLLRLAMPKRSRWKRHLPAALLLGSLAALTFGAARPRMAISVPIGRTSIILALDVSRSMCATDVAPNRLKVAQDSARAFVAEQPAGTRIGIVAFAGSAELIVAPTTDKKSLTSAIDGLTTQRGTVIGAALLKSLDAIAEVNPDVAPIGNLGSSTDPVAGSGPTTKPAEGYVPDIVVLLTDGANTRGVDPVTAAQQAVDRRVRVYTIGFGTTQPTGIVCTREQVGGQDISQEPGGFAGGGAGGAGGRGGRFLIIDEPTLQKVADMTGGSYYRAQDAPQLQKVFADLPRNVVLQKRKQEIAVLFVALGAMIAGLAVVLSLRWNPYP